MSDESEYAARWDEELEQLGKNAVITRLGIKAASGTGPGASFRLWIPQLPDPSRGYVEE
jgi:hypothetical protein